MEKGSGTGAIGLLSKSRGWPVCILLFAMAPLVFSGCYGSFPLTKAIYGMNGDISDNKIVQTVTFWVFVIFPVYEIGMFADAIIFNLVEFWSGDTVVAVGPTMDSHGNLVSLTPSADGRTAVLTVSRDGRVVATESFVKVSDSSFEVRNAQGKVDGKVLRAADGTISLTDKNGKVLRTLPAGALAAL